MAGSERASQRPHPGDSQFADQEIRRALAEARARQSEEAAARERPQARERRARSRTAYRGLGRAEALATNRARHAGIFRARPWRSLDLLPGERVDEYRGSHGALVAAEDRRVLAESTLPLRAKGAAGILAPVDLSLEERAAGYEPRVPLTPVRIGSDVREGIVFARAGFSFRLLSARADPGLLADGKAFFANTAEDTDFLVRPVPVGVETFFSVRSPEAPERTVLRFAASDTNGPAVRLVEVPRMPLGAQPEIHVLLGADLVGTIEPPAAVDAAGENVPVRYEARGADLLLTYPHRDRDFEYPVLVDPIVSGAVKENWNLDGDGNTVPGTDTWPDWTWAPNPSNLWAGYSSTDPGNRGLTVWTAPATFSDGMYGEWLWQAPRQSFMERADFGYVTTTNYAGQGMCTIEGIWSPSRGNWDFGQWLDVYNNYGSSPTLRSGEACRSDLANNYKAHCVGWYDPPAGRTASCVPGVGPDPYQGTPGNMMVFGMLKNGAGNTTSYPAVRMEGATIWLYDNDVPNLSAPSHNGLPSDWVKDANITTSVSASEPAPGLGVYAFNLFRPGASTLTLYARPDGSTTSDANGGICRGDRMGRCPVSASGQFTWSTGGMTDGTQTVTLIAYDAVQKQSTPRTWQVKVDRSGPRIELSGALASMNGKWTASDHALRIDAFDGDAANPRSGVKSIEVLVDNTRAFYAEQSAGDNAPMSRDWTYKALDYGEGPHTIEVVATDRAGNSTRAAPITVKNDLWAPIATTSGELADRDGQVVNDEMSLFVHATDGEAASPESGVKTIQILVDGDQADLRTQACAADNCEMEYEWVFRPSAYTEGDHRIDVVVTDQVGNTDDAAEEDEESLVVTVQYQQGAQTVESAGHAGPRVNGPVPGEAAGQSLAVIGDINGDDFDDYAVGAPLASGNLRLRSGSVYVLYGDGTNVVPDLNTIATTGRGFRIFGASDSDLAGAAVAPAGDVNGDAIPDIAIGAPGAIGAPRQLESGRLTSGDGIYLVLGFGLCYYGERPEDYFGVNRRCPESAADAVPVGDDGHVYVVFGGTTNGDLDLANLGARGFQVNPPAQGATGFGASVSGATPGTHGSAGDVNGDGLDDIIVGSPGESRTSPGSGSAYVIFGKAGAAPVSAEALTGQGFRLDGAGAEHRAGDAVAMLGDVDNDGLADVAVGAPGAAYDSRADTGSAYVVYGSATPSDNILLGRLGWLDNRGYPVYGQSGDGFGASLAAVGDVNGDDLADLAVGARGAWVLFGQESSSGIDLAAGPAPGYRIVGPPGDDYAQAVVGHAGDLNGDVIPDVLIGFPLAGPTLARQGVAYAVFGQALSQASISLTGLPGHRGTRVLGATVGSNLGAALAGLERASELDSGFLIGAPNDSAAAGSAYLFRSSAMSGTVNATAAASDPGLRRTRANCWGGSGAYTFRIPKDHPSCRRTRRGKTEFVERTHRFGTARAKLEQTLKRDASGSVKTYDIVDSFGRKFAALRQESHISYRVYDAAGTEYRPLTPKELGTTARRPMIEVQGRACMATKALAKAHVMITFSAPRDSEGRATADGSAVDIGFRGFITRDALRNSTLAKQSDRRFVGQTNDEVIERYRITCGEASQYKSVAGLPITTIPKPAFGKTHDRYQGEKSAPRATSIDDWCGRKKIKVRNPNCAYKYYPYARPSFAGDVTYLMSGSAAIRRGGLVRAVIRTSTSVRSIDSVDYEDPNIPCGDSTNPRERIGRWSFVDANPTAARLDRDPNTRNNQQVHIYGWYPRRVASGAMRTC